METTGTSTSATSSALTSTTSLVRPAETSPENLNLSGDECATGPPATTGPLHHPSQTPVRRQYEAPKISISSSSSPYVSLEGENRITSTDKEKQPQPAIREATSKAPVSSSDGADYDFEVKQSDLGLKNQFYKLTAGRKLPKNGGRYQEGDGVFQEQQVSDDDCVIVGSDDEIVADGIAMVNVSALASDDDDAQTAGNWSIEEDLMTTTSFAEGNEKNYNRKSYQNRKRKPNKPNNHNVVSMSEADIAVCQQLDAEYERALEERDVTYTARYQSVRQSACLSIFFMGLFMILGTLFFERQSEEWGLEESLLFTVYTITTVGYGHLETPDTPAFQLYTIFFIFIGIALLTILVAQVYQCIALEATRAATISTDSRSSMRIWLAAHIQSHRHYAQHPLQKLNNRQATNENNDYNQHHNDDHYTNYHLQNQGFDPRSVDFWPHLIERCLFYLDTALTFFRENEYGRSLSIVLPFAGLIAIGAVVVGTLEGWTGIESIYFAVVSLTTVGFGDYYPTRSASIWFCILWLPFSIGFMSMYLGNVAAFYIRLSDRNIERIEEHLRRGIQEKKEQTEQERLIILQRALRGQEHLIHPKSETNLAQIPFHSDHTKAATTSSLTGNVGHDLMMEVNVGDEDEINNGKQENRSMKMRRAANRFRGFSTVPMKETSVHSSGDASVNETRRPHLFGSGPSSRRREQVLQNSTSSFGQSEHLVTSMATMKDVLRAIHQTNSDRRSRSNSDDEPLTFQTGPASTFLSIRSSTTMKDSYNTRHSQSVLKPSFALRALVQERFAEIIATDIAGYQSNIQIKEYTLSVTIDTLKRTADKWLVPRRARRAFRAVAFEALYFVGEHGLITRGADALLSLSPFEFHQIFSPLLAAFGDAETMDEWLMHTEVLADVEFRGASIVTIDPLVSAPVPAPSLNIASGNDQMIEKRINDEDDHDML